MEKGTVGSGVDTTGTGIHGAAATEIHKREYNKVVKYMKYCMKFMRQKFSQNLKF